MKRYQPLFEKQSYIIYCDLDGVLVDLNQKSVDEFGMEISQMISKYDQDTFWGKVDKIDHFFYNSKWTKDGKKLWGYIKQYNPKILSSPAYGVEQCKEDKQKWVKNNLGNYSVILTNNKEDYADINTILIDDREDNITTWNRKRGIGILHKTTESTIIKLKELGL